MSGKIFFQAAFPQSGALDHPRRFPARALGPVGICKPRLSWKSKTHTESTPTPYTKGYDSVSPADWRWREAHGLQALRCSIQQAICHLHFKKAFMLHR